MSLAAEVYCLRGQVCAADRKVALKGDLHPNAIDQSDGGACRDADIAKTLLPPRAIAGRFVFSQGDETGYGYHGDFLNGWDANLLASVVADGTQSCAWDLNGAEGARRETYDCPLFNETLDPEFGYNCAAEAVFNEPGEWDPSVSR